MPASSEASRLDALPDVAPVEQPTNKEPPASASRSAGKGAQALRPSIAQALCWRRRRERTTDPEPCRSVGIRLDR